jgi:predicted phosphoribosyltransferase
MLFKNRRDAGRQLALRLTDYKGRTDVIVLGLPRGGVPVAYEVAIALDAPLDVMLVRKLGVPARPELAMGAIAYGGVQALNKEIVQELGITDDEITEVTRAESAELDRQVFAFRDDRPFPDVRNRTVILVDDGLATGSTMVVAVTALRQMQPGRVIVAVPVGASRTCAMMNEVADEAICANEPPSFVGVGMWYDDFSQTSDAEVRQLLAKAAERFLSATG